MCARAVRASEVVLLVQSAEVLLRPWCILEIHAAVTAAIPIIAVQLRGGEYDFATARHTLTYLDTELDRRNPGATAILQQHSVQPVDAAYLLANVIPNLISIEFDASASSNVIKASIDDMMHEIRALRHAPAAQVHISRTDWLQQRGKNPNDAPMFQRAPSGVASGALPPLGSSVLPSIGSFTIDAGFEYARLPPEVPPLPKGYVMREALTGGIKAKLLQQEQDGAAVVSPSAPIVSVHGMGGSGKTVVASALCNDVELRSTFDRVCFVAVGQTPEMAELRKSLYRQLVGRPLDASLLGDEALIFQALEEAVRVRNRSALTCIRTHCPHSCCRSRAQRGSVSDYCLGRQRGSAYSW